MTPRPDLKTALWIMGVFLVTGILCYASFSPPSHEEPLRIMLQNKGGPVLFTHSRHTYDYGIDCADCHHNDDGTYNCSACHLETGDESLLSRADALHDQCIGCHDAYGLPTECSSCHAPR